MIGAAGLGILGIAACGTASLFPGANACLLPRGSQSPSPLLWTVLKLGYSRSHSHLSLPASLKQDNASCRSIISLQCDRQLTAPAKSGSWVGLEKSISPDRRCPIKMQIKPPIVRARSRWLKVAFLTRSSITGHLRQCASLRSRPSFQLTLIDLSKTLWPDHGNRFLLKAAD